VASVHKLRTPAEPDLRAVVAELADRLAAVEARLPARPIVLPANWITPKQAAAESGYSEPSIYRLCRRGKIVAMKIGGKIAVDRGRLAKRKPIK